MRPQTGHCYYQHFYVEPTHDRPVQKAAAFDGEIGQELADFLDALDIAAFLFVDGSTRPLNAAGRLLQERHG